ncbi:MAG: hypothetical protein ABIK68_07265 [bacterium]
MKAEDPYLYGQISNTFLGLAAGLSAMVVSSILYLWQGQFFYLLLSVLVSIIIVVSLFFFIQNPVRYKPLTSNIVALSIVLGACAISLSSGGIRSSAIIWFTFVPAFMVFLNGSNKVLFWLVPSLVIINLFYFISKITFAADFSAPASAQDLLFDLIILTLSSTLTMAMVDSTRKKTLNKLHYIRKDLENKNNELQKALKEVKELSGLLPICAQCKKIRDDKGYWNQLESYIEKHSDARFSHGICGECAEELYGDAKWYQKGKKEGRFKS